MATEQYAFWQMVLQAPATIAVAGGLAGSLLTLMVALVNNWHNTKMKRLEWELAERTRKEQRLFECKRAAYDEFAACFEFTQVYQLEQFNRHFVPMLTRLSNYGSNELRKEIKRFADYINAKCAACSVEELPQLRQEIAAYLDRIHSLIIEDIESHHTEPEKKNSAACG